MIIQPRIDNFSESFPALGTWIEIEIMHMIQQLEGSRSLHWERGLKSSHTLVRSQPSSSFPALGTWIEMIIQPRIDNFSESFPALGTWIEISIRLDLMMSSRVVPCIGNVD